MSTIPRSLGKYELLQQLGRGSAGEVWKGYDTQLHCDVAIKLIHADLQSDPHFMTRFTSEGQILTELQHSNIVPVREVNISRPPQTSETTAYLVMDYIEGQTLADYINATSHKGYFPTPDQIVYLFTSLGVAIDYAHQHGIIHGNIKPANILLDRNNTEQFENGEPMLVDAGLTQLPGATTSSPFYMSPEQAKGHAPNNRSDIYALGVILYEMCTGVQPFRDESSVAVMLQHINMLPTPPNLINPNIPPALSEVILRAMSKDTHARFSMASLLAAAIADACAMQPLFSSHDRLIANEEDDAAYLTSRNIGPILGVSQPLPQISLRLPVSQPLPQISGPLTRNTNKQPTMRTNPHVPAPAQIVVPTPSRKIPTTLSNQVTGPIPNPLQTNKIPIATPSVKMATPSPVPFLTALPPTSSLTQPLFPVATTQSHRRFIDTPIYIAFGALALLLLVISSAIGASVLLKNNQQTAATTKVLTGHVFFQDDAFGHSDQVHIELSNVAAPTNGKSYFAWLQNSNKQIVLLGQLPWRVGNISYTYSGNTKHSNLLATAQSFSITQQNSSSNPQFQPGQEIYQANFDNVALPYIKNILLTTPGLPSNQSVVDGLLETIKSLNDKADSIYDSLLVKRDNALVHRQATRIIEMIDGTQYAMTNGDLPNQYAPQTNVKVGLLSSSAQQGYLDILATQLDKLRQVTGENAVLLQRVQNIQNAVSDLQDWMQKMRSYDVQILKAADLTDPALIRVALQLKNTAADSYIGHTIPPNPAPLPTRGSAGASQAYTEAQYMVALDIKPV